MLMTLFDKQKKLENFCDEHLTCEDCPLREPAFEPCYEELNFVEEHYERVFGDTVNHPHHYNDGSIECIDAMVSAFGKVDVATFCAVNAFKYIWRYKNKHGEEDLDKAAWYLDKRKELMESE